MYSLAGGPPATVGGLSYLRGWKLGRDVLGGPEIRHLATGDLNDLARGIVGRPNAVREVTARNHLGKEPASKLFNVSSKLCQPFVSWWRD